MQFGNTDLLAHENLVQGRGCHAAELNTQEAFGIDAIAVDVRQCTQQCFGLFDLVGSQECNIAGRAQQIGYSATASNHPFVQNRDMAADLFEIG